jgi:TetR/AcrR family transcriptional regulator, tetracycline repressor protein
MAAADPTGLGSPGEDGPAGSINIRGARTPFDHRTVFYRSTVFQSRGDRMTDTRADRAAGDPPAASGPVVPPSEPGRLDEDIEPAWWKGKRAAASRTQLSRDAIVEAAVRILQTDGYDGLTIRRLSQELGTGAASLYWHIAGKDELAELVWDHIMGAIELPDPDPEHWQDQMKAMARSSYEVMLGHRDAVRLSLGRIPVGPNMLRMMEWMLSVLRAAGVPDDVAIFFGDLMGRYIDASVLEEQWAQLPGDGPDAEEPGRALWEHFMSLPPDRFPNLLAVLPSMMGRDDRAAFELGLDILVAGLEAHVVRPGPSDQPAADPG